MLNRSDHLSDRVGFGSLRVSGQKMLGHARPMTWSGWVGLARNFVCNFWVGLSFGSNISARTRLVTWSSQIGSGFFSNGLGRVYRIRWPVIRSRAK